MSLLKKKKQLIAIALAAMLSVGAGVSAVTAATPKVSAASNNGSIMLDTANYIMAPGNIYDIGVTIKDPSGRTLSGSEVQALYQSGKLKISDSRTGSIANLTQLSNGNFRVTGKNQGTCYIVYDIGGTHASVKIDVQNGVRQHGTAVRHTSYFVTNVFNSTTNNTSSTTITQNKKINLFDVCNAYDVSAFRSEQDGTSTFRMAGQKYTNGFEVSTCAAYKTRASFNVKGAYNTLEFDVGHIDDTKAYGLSLDIFFDGRLVKTIEKESDDLPIHYTLDVRGVKQIIFQSNGDDEPDNFSDAYAYTHWVDFARYGLGNMTLS